MNILSLNTWAGRLQNDLYPFIKEQKDTVDVFCFQELLKDVNDVDPVFADGNTKLGDEIEEILSDFTPVYSIPNPDSICLGTFYRKTLAAKDDHELFVRGTEGSGTKGQPETAPRTILAVTVEENGQLYTIINFHGLWVPDSKDDTDERIEQSKKIREYMDSLDTNIILVGDFNLDVDTESLKILEGGRRNLITDYGITSTRNEHYTKTDCKYADYAVISLSVNLKKFSVLPDVVSDHQALLLELE